MLNVAREDGQRQIKKKKETSFFFYSFYSGWQELNISTYSEDNTTSILTCQLRFRDRATYPLDFSSRHHQLLKKTKKDVEIDSKNFFFFSLFTACEGEGERGSNNQKSKASLMRVLDPPPSAPVTKQSALLES